MATHSARNIGAMFDSEFTLVPQVNSVVKSCYSHLRQIAHIRQFLTLDATATLVNAIITSRLDYANSLLIGLPKCVTRKLELVQNNSARLIYMKRKRDHATPLLESLHWLPIEFRIKYKINLLTYKALHGLAPSYLSCLLETYIPIRSLRSSSLKLLCEKKTKSKAGARAFSVCAPKLWNTLPFNIRSSNSLATFKTALKTYYFKLAFNL